MSTQPPRTALERIVADAERHISDCFAAVPDGRVSLMEFARCVDTLLVPISLKWHGFDGNARVLTQYLFGLAPMLRTIFRDFSSLPGFPLVASSKNMFQTMVQFWQYAGDIGLCQHWLELERLGLLTLERQEDRFRFRLTTDPIGIEALEVEDALWYTDLIRRSHEAYRSEFEARRPVVQHLLDELVENWREHFIQYDAHPALDEYFINAGVLYSQTLYGVDAFPGSARFGGFEFVEYRGALAILVGIAMKHAAFCQALVKKRPDTSLHNILTIYRSRSEMIEEIATATGTNENFAARVLELTTLTADNLQWHTRIPGDIPGPVFVVAGTEMLLRPLFGPLRNPYRFLLDEIRRRYPSDWDKSVDSREAAFRNDLFTLFPVGRYACVPRGVLLRQNGVTVTDIDAVIFDQDTGEIGLFQLKWQDAFGNDMRARESRKKNLIHTANDWVVRTLAWLSSTPADELHSRLGLNALRSTAIRQIRLFVLGRHASHFSGVATLSSSAAWGMWPQVIRLIAEGVVTDPKIGGLHDALIAASPYKKPRPRAPLQEIQIGQFYVQYGEDDVANDGGDGV